jgi:catechol 2,3-dioxygenase-like lactoylglutathione lyase family enzyme
MTKINQLAVCCTDFYRSAYFYEHIFGLDSVFGTICFRGAAAEGIQGMPNPASKVRWFLDGTDYFQLELFQFEHPKPALFSEEYSVKTEGYSHLIFAVNSLDRFCQDMLESGFQQSIAIIETEQRRYAKTTDPDGVILEVIEDSSLVVAGRNSVVVGVGLTAVDFDATVSVFVDTYQFVLVDDCFEREQVWGDTGTLGRTATLKQRDKYLIVSEFNDVVPRSAHYQLCDVGVMNLSLGYANKESFWSAVDATKKAGCKHNCEPQQIGDILAGTYSTTPQDYSVEMVYCDPSQYGQWGWAEPSNEERLSNYKRNANALKHYVLS